MSSRTGRTSSSPPRSPRSASHQRQQKQQLESLSHNDNNNQHQKKRRSSVSSASSNENNVAHDNSSPSSSSPYSAKDQNQNQKQQQQKPALAAAERFRKIEKSVRIDGSRSAYFAMNFMNSVLSQPPRRPDVVRRRRYDASLSLMDVIRGAADSTEHLQPQWPLEYPLMTVDAVRRKAIVRHIRQPKPENVAEEEESNRRKNRKKKMKLQRQSGTRRKTNPLDSVGGVNNSDDEENLDDDDDDDEYDGYDELVEYRRSLGLPTGKYSNNSSNKNRTSSSSRNKRKASTSTSREEKQKRATEAAVASALSSGSDLDGNEYQSSHDDDDENNTQHHSTNKKNNNSSSTTSTTKPVAKLEYEMRAMTTIRIPLMRLGLPPVLLHFWGLLDPSDPLKEGWTFLPASDKDGANGDVFKNALDHAGLNLFVDWPAKNFVNDLFDADFSADDSNNNSTNSNDEGSAQLAGITVTAPSASLLQDCRTDYFGSNTKPGDDKSNPRRSCYVASMVVEQCNRKLDLPSSIEYVIKSAFSEWAVAWRAKRQIWRASMKESAFGDDADASLFTGTSMNDSTNLTTTSMMNESSIKSSFHRSGDPDLSAAAVALAEQTRMNPVNPLLELEGYSLQTSKVLNAHAAAAGRSKKKLATVAAAPKQQTTSTLTQQHQHQHRKSSSPSASPRNQNLSPSSTSRTHQDKNNNNNGDDNVNPIMSPTEASTTNLSAQQQQKDTSFAGVFESSYTTFMNSQNSLVNNDVDSNPFISLTAFIAARLRGLVEKCIACQTPLIRTVVRPSTCGQELCNYSSSRYGTDFLVRLQRGSGAVAEFLILCGINAVATQREMLMPMCDIVVDDDSLSWQPDDEIQQQEKLQQQRQAKLLARKKKLEQQQQEREKQQQKDKTDNNNDSGASPAVTLSPTSPVASPTSTLMMSLNISQLSQNGSAADLNNGSTTTNTSSSSGIYGLAQRAVQAASTPKSRHQDGQNRRKKRHVSDDVSGGENETDDDVSTSSTDEQDEDTNNNINNNKKPFAHHFYKKAEDVGTGSNKNISLLIQTLNHLPAVPRLLALTRQLSLRYSSQQVEKFLMKFISREAVMGLTGNSGAHLHNEEGRVLAGPFLRWLFSSLPGELALLPKTHLIPRVKSEIQFLIIGSDPEREARFQALKLRELERRKLAIAAAEKTRSFMQNFTDEKDDSDLYADSKNDPFISGTKTRASFFAWHGSGPQNWHSILRNGLRNMSHTHMMTTGALHGGGIYASRSMHIAMSYSLQPVAGWSRASVIPHTTGISVISLCEIVDWNGVSVKAPDPRIHPQFRKNHQKNHQSQPTDPVQIHADGQIVTVLHDDYIMPRVLIVYTDRTPKNMDGFELEMPESLLSWIENQYSV